MASTHIDYRKIDYDQLIDRPITRTSANVDTIKTAGVYDRGDGKRFLVIVDDNTITQIEESYNGYRTRTSTDGGFVRGAWTTAEFSDTNAKRDVVVISGTEPVEKRETTAWIDTSDENKFKVYDGTDWMVISGQSIQTEEMPTASEELEGKIIQYEGDTTSTFTHGYFYECVGDGQTPETFSRVRIDVQPNNTTASNVSYDNTTSGMTATNVQDAIDETDSSIDAINTTLTTVQENITELQNIVEVTTMDTPSEDNEGSIVQYKGATNANFTHGYFYECVGDGQDPESFSRVNINVQDNPGQAETMPIPSVENLGQIIQYTGDTNNYYTHAHFYEVIEDSENPGEYIYQEVEVQDSPAQAEIMDEASEDNVGKIIQYVGTTNANFTHGYFYESVSDGQDPATYSWVNVKVQDGTSTVQLTQAQYDALPSSKLTDGIDYEIYTLGEISPVDGEPIQKEVLPTADSAHVGAIHQYIGDTTSTYTKGYFYICVSDGQDPATYTWQQVDVQPASGGTTYTAGDGIDITNNVISSDMSTAEYDNTTSGLTATTMQGAIDEIDSSVDTINSSITTINGDITDIKNIIEVTTMDTASASNEGSIVQYKGATTSTYTNGYFYKCVESSTPGTYEWTRIDVQPSSGGGSTYTAGNNIDITNDVISADTNEFVTRTEYDQLPASKLTNDKTYFIKTSVPGGREADVITYDNTTSGLTATNVQDAIDELKASVPTVVVVPHGTTEQIPETPVVGQMFYNTTDYQLLMFDGTNWNSITKTTYHIMGDTITMTYTEGSTSDFVVVYGDDAESWTQGDSRFDEFFGYKPVLLSAAGVETAELDPNDFTKDIDGNAVNITSGDNVMIKFPIRGIKATKSGSDVTISLTKDANAEAEGYSYYAFSRGTFDTPIKKDCFYIGAYEGYFSSNVMKSRSGKEPTCSKTHAQFMAAARANDGNTGDAGYEYEGFYQRDYINALYMLKYGNGDSQATFGQGIVNSSKHNTGTTNDKGMNYGTQSQTEAIKLFGIENYRGNCTEYVGGCCSDGSMNFYTALSHFTGDVTTSGDYYKDSGIDVPSNTSGRQGRSKTAGTNKGIFVPVEANGTQYNDRFAGAASRLLNVSGLWDCGSHAGAFVFSLYYAASYSHSYDASRLMFL